jgi:glycosyltransferase involved in cell wall biosynthesis
VNDGRVRVAHVITRLEAGAGGVALRGCLAADPTRYAFAIFTATGGSLVGEARAAGLKVIEMSSMRPDVAPRADARAYLRLVAELEAGGFDIVHTHSAKAGGIGRTAAASVGITRTVHTFHGFPFHAFQSAQRRVAYTAMERWLGRRTARFLAVGGEVAAEAVRRRIAPPDLIRVIPVAIRPDVPLRTAASRAEARRRLGLPADARVVGTAGRLDHQKAPHHLVRAAGILPQDVITVWFGDGPLRERSESLARRMGLEGRFRFLGFRPDVTSLLPALDVFAMSSLYEGLPCAVLEAMTCGIPVVASAVNSVPEVVLPGTTGLLVPPGAPDLLARALRFLLDRPDQADRMATAARQHIGRRFLPEVLGRALDETYVDLLGEDPRRSDPSRSHRSAVALHHARRTKIHAAAVAGVRGGERR